MLKETGHKYLKENRRIIRLKGTAVEIVVARGQTKCESDLCIKMVKSVF